MNTEDWGTIDYRQAWLRQTELFDQTISDKLAGRPTVDRLVLCEHPPVITLGRRAVQSNVLFSRESLQQQGIQLYNIDRGGDVTYHGPGQLVVYPIFDLEHYGIGIKEYVNRLEEVVIRLLASFNITASRWSGGTGVWINPEEPRLARKICAIGVRSSRYVTMHGLALNVNTHLNHFSLINPCGFVDRGVTSIQQELQRTLPLNTIKQEVVQHFSQLFTPV